MWCSLNVLGAGIIFVPINDMYHSIKDVCIHLQLLMDKVMSVNMILSLIWALHDFS
jgi:nitrite reductase/ring-hydroxylating ferredoxin subunit